MHKEMKKAPAISDVTTGFAGSPMANYLADNPHLDKGVPLDELIWEQAQKTPDATAIIDGDNIITYAQLQHRATKVAAALHSRGRTPGERILLHLGNSISFIDALLGTLCAGCVPVLTLAGHRHTELSHLAKLSDARELVGTDEKLLHDVATAMVEAGLPEPTVHIGQMPTADAAEFSPHPGFAPVLPAVLLVSGGTTGLPKLIARTHQDYRYDALCAATACHISSSDVYLAALPLSHNFPLASPGMFGVLAHGGTVVCAASPSPDAVFELIEKHQVTVVAAVPSLALLWAEATEWEPADVSSLRMIQVGGARFSPEQATQVDEAFPGKLQQVFGMAEGLLCFTTPGDPDRQRVRNTQGYPMSPLDELRTGADGGLEVRGPYTILGYYRAPEANTTSFTADGWYRSGDKVQVRDDGAVVVLGRIKDVVIKAGENVDCVEVEEVLSQVEGVSGVVVVGAPDEFLGEAVVAAVVPDAGAEPSLAALRGAVNDAGLADFKQPDRILIIDNIPLTAVGKPDRKVVAGWANTRKTAGE